MAGEWPIQRLPDLLTLQRGHDLASDKRVAGEFPVIAATGQVGVHNEAKCDAPGVVIGRSGSIGGAQWIDEPFWPLNTTLYVIDFKGNNPYFCYSVLKSIDFQPFNAGSGVPTLNRNHLADIQVPAISRAEQDRIANLLHTLDAKIELNRQMAATLEDMARALFKSWFVDFDPVHAKAEGRETGLPVDIAALFPNSFNDEGLPLDWVRQPVEAYLQLAYGKSLPATAREAGEIPVYGSGGIGGFHNQALVSGPGIIVGRKGSVGTLYWEQGDFFPIDTVFYVKPNDGYSLPFLWEMLRTFPLSEMNADGAVPGLNRSHALQLEFPCPSPPLRDAFDMFSTSMMARASALKHEEAAVTSLRDTLIPKLLSGELRVADAETVIAAA